MRHASYPFVRTIDADGGGAADLQTDVMRFMAIISMCLVAIFALVQSIPTQVSIPAAVPSPLPQSAPPAQPVENPPEPVPVPETTPQPIPHPGDSDPNSAHPGDSDPDTVRVTVPETVVPKPIPAPMQEGDSDPDSVRVTVPESKVTVPELGQSGPSEGFTLRFASDQALTALVAREDIGFYAIVDDSASRMQYDRGRVEFWQSSVPKQYHEMDASTVPSSVRDALRRTGQTADVTWGVTLPSRLSRELNRYLSSYSGGDLIIAANGTMRREEG